MGGRVTRTPQSGELARAKSLQRALKHGASPAFIPPDTPNPPAQPSALSWYSTEKHSAESGSPQKTTEEILDLHRQYLEQLFESSPDAIVVLDASFRTQCVSREFQSMFGYSASQAMGQRITHSLFLRSAQPNPIGLRNACGVANRSLSKPSAAAKMDRCSTSPFPLPP